MRGTGKPGAAMGPRDLQTVADLRLTGRKSKRIVTLGYINKHKHVPAFLEFTSLRRQTTYK